MPSDLYRLFGLTVDSEIPLPNALPGRGEPDATIRVGGAPEAIDDPVGRGVLYAAKPGVFLLNMRRIARYLVRDGREVIVAPNPEADEASVRTFLFTAVLAALLHQRGATPLHASSVVIDGAAVLIMGGSGAGKSTLAAELQRRGHAVLADDVTVVERAGDGLIAHPGVAAMKVWDDALRRMELDPDTLNVVRPGVQKYLLPASGTPADAVPVTRAFIISVEGEGDLSTDPVTGVEKMQAMLFNTYRRTYVRALGQEVAHFQACADIGARLSIQRLHRPRRQGTVRAIADIIEKGAGA